MIFGVSYKQNTQELFQMDEIAFLPNYREAYNNAGVVTRTIKLPCRRTVILEDIKHFSLSLNKFLRFNEKAT